MSMIIEQLSADLMFTSGYIYRLLRHMIQKEGVGWTALMVLKTLEVAGPLSQKELCEIEQVTSATMSILIKKMLSAQLITKEQDNKDKRKTIIIITEKGKQHLQTQGKTMHKTIQNLLQQLTPQELADLHNGQKALSLILQKEL